MTREELRQLAIGYLEGKDGMPKNETKGWETMQQAADQGDAIACERYAAHIVTRAPEDALRYIESAGVPDDAIPVYVQAKYLAFCKNGGDAKNVYAAAKRSAKDNRDEQTLYYLAKLGQAADPKDAEVKATFGRLALSGCKLMTDEDYAACGRERGVAIGYDELQTFIDSYIGDHDNRVVLLVKKTKSEGMAKAILESNLDTDNAVKYIGKARIKKLKNATPRVVLEYQKIYESDREVEVGGFSYRHQDPSSVTYTTGSGTVEIGKTYAGYGTAFVSPAANTDLYKKMNAYEYDDGTPDAAARFRVHTANDQNADRFAYDQAIKAEKEAVEAKAKRFVADKYGWNSYHIEVDCRLSSTEDRYSCGILFVPFYFFVYDLGGETVSIRVNAFNGDVDYHINNPFGLSGSAADGGGTAGTFWDKFHVGVFIALTLFTLFGGVAYALLHILVKLTNKPKKKK